MKTFFRKSKWRFARILLAAFVFIATCCILWCIPGTEEYFGIQYGSALLKLFADASLGAAAGVISITLVTLLCGRIYCSVICPLGIMQDILLIRRKKNSFIRWTGKFKYPFFLLCIAALLAGVMLPLTLFVPSANFVQIVNFVFREILQWTGIAAATLRPAPAAALAAWGFFILLIVLVRWKGRIYCNTLCPVGTLLGIFSRFSWFKIRIKQEKCISCGACERSCKAGCIDAKNKEVKFENCVMCMNCLDSCKLDALHFTHDRTKPAEHSPGRRDFLIGGTTLLGAAAIGGLGGGMLRKSSKSQAVMPPGAGTYDRFAVTCLGCGLCISSCKGKVLQPAVGQYGLRGFMQPFLDFEKGTCQFDCKRCMEVCPCGALQKMTLPEKQQHRIGIATYHPQRCVAYLEDMDCGACSEHCPVGALDMVPYKNTLIPKVNEKLCIGCGACQNICPVLPVKAITVSGVSPQIKVEKPKIEKSQKLEAEEDFPF